MSKMNPSIQFNDEEFKPSLQEIKDIVGLPDWKIINVYLYGSRVYGTCHRDSDFDFLVVARSLDREREIRSGRYNIHVHTPDKFEDDLMSYRMVNMECIYAPSFARFQECTDFFRVFKINPFVFKKAIFKQSHDAWLKASIKFREMDIDRATKSLFHSLRILAFGIYIFEEDDILDFSLANSYWDEISKIEEFKWNIFKEKFLPQKKGLENILMNAEQKMYN